MPQNPRRRLTTAYYSSFLLLGITAAILGPSLLRLAEQTRTSVGEVSIFFPVRAGAYLFGSWLSGHLYDRYPGHRLLIIALIVMGISLALIPVFPAPELIVGVLAVLGIGMGLLDVGINTLLVWAYQEEVGAYLNGLHFFYGLGSFLSPLILAQIFQINGGIRVTYWLFALLTIPILLQFLSLPSPEAPSTIPDGVHPGMQGESQLPRGLIWPLGMMALFLFFYVGVEVGFGAWIYTFGVESGLENDISAAYLTSVFWGAFTLGRLMSIPLATRFHPREILAVDLVGAVISLGLILLWPGVRFVLWMGTIGLGLAIASIFPSAFSFMDRKYYLTGKISSWLFVSGGLGAVIIPWVMGQFVERSLPYTIPGIILIAALAAAGFYWSFTNADELKTVDAR
ncbi:MAG: MFS transporter [Anaerolineales bacterium]|nr:MFS transporter [Anaerolineales bacterium]